MLAAFMEDYVYFGMAFFTEATICSLLASSWSCSTTNGFACGGRFSPLARLGLEVECVQ
jgi:hypothetical protein